MILVGGVPTPRGIAIKKDNDDYALQKPHLADPAESAPTRVTPVCNLEG